MLVTDEDALAGSAHAISHVVFFQSVQACEHRGIFFWLVLFSTEGVITEGEQADGRRLVGVERFRDNGPFHVSSLFKGSPGGKERSADTYGYEVCSAFRVTVDIAHCVAGGSW